MRRRNGASCRKIHGCTAFTLASSEIVDLDSGELIREDFLERGDVSDSDVDNVNVVPDSGTVHRVVVLAIHGQLLPPSYGHLSDERHQVVGDALRVFADLTAGVRPDGVEVTKQDRAPVLKKKIICHMKALAHLSA